MGPSAWSFQGSDYEIRWEPAAGAGRLAWGERLALPALFPLLSCSRAPGPEPAGDPLRSLPAGARRRLRRWNAPGALQGLAADAVCEAGAEALRLCSPAAAGGLHLSWSLACRPDRILLTADVENRGAQDVRLHALAPLAGSLSLLRGGPPAWRFFKMGSNTTLPSGSVSMAGSERSFGIGLLPARLLPGPVKRMLLLPDESVHVRRGSFSSQWFTLWVHPESGAAALLGFTGVRRHFSTLRLDVPAGCFQAAAAAGGCTLAPGDRFTSHPLLLLFASTPEACLDAYLQALDAPRPPPSRSRPISLWGSWYAGFYDRFRWEDLQGNLTAAGRAPRRVEYFQLDDGYQRAVGDWTEALPCLPEGLEGFARRVREAGMRPGLWVAPFAAGQGSAVHREHPAWLVRGPSGKPVRAGFMAGRFRLRPYYALDLTRPEVLDWLRGLFTTLSGLGFDLFKLDFLAAGTVPGVRWDPRTTVAQSYGDGLAAIRDAVGDRLLLGALAPQLCGLGTMDLQRVSADSSFGRNTWQSRLQRWTRDAVTPCILNNLRNNFTRAFLADRCWVNDCDAVLAGGLSPAEQRTHLTVNILLGGVFQVGFDLRKPGYPWEPVERLLAARPWARRVPDLFESRQPCEAFVAARMPDGQAALLYLTVNASPAARRRTVRDPGPFPPGWDVLWEQARDFWSGEPFRLLPGESHTVEARDSRLLHIPLKRA